MKLEEKVYPPFSLCRQYMVEFDFKPDDSKNQIALYISAVINSTSEDIYSLYSDSKEFYIKIIDVEFPITMKTKDWNAINITHSGDGYCNVHVNGQLVTETTPAWVYNTFTLTTTNYHGNVRNFVVHGEDLDYNYFVFNRFRKAGRATCRRKYSFKYD